MNHKQFITCRDRERDGERDRGTDVVGRGGKSSFSKYFVMLTDAHMQYIVSHAS